MRFTDGGPVPRRRKYRRARADLDAECGRELGRDALDRLARRCGRRYSKTMVVGPMYKGRPGGLEGRAGRVALAQLAEHVGARAGVPTKARRSRHADRPQAWNWWFLLPFASTAAVVRWQPETRWGRRPRTCSTGQGDLLLILPAALTSIGGDARAGRACAARALLCFLDGCGFSAGATRGLAKNIVAR